MELTFNSKKLWEIPKPSGDRAARPSHDRVTQVKFYNEYYPTGHKIFNPAWYNDILIKDEDGTRASISVNRVSVSIQAMAIDIILAHLLETRPHR